MRQSAMLALFVLCVWAVAAAPNPQPVALPAPQTGGGKPLMQALQERASHREFAPDPLPPQVLANLLWRPGASIARITVGAPHLRR